MTVLWCGLLWVFCLLVCRGVCFGFFCGDVCFVFVVAVVLFCFVF